ncbi:MAG: hypothetical protein ACLQIB_28505 [Isosphaeraceae bacterium]
MFGCTLWSTVLGWLCLVNSGQAGDPQAERSGRTIPVAAARDEVATVEVTASKLEVYDRPHPTAFLTGNLKQGVQVNVREQVAGGWLAIDPPSSAICWIDGSSLDFGSDTVRSGSHFGDPAGSTAAIPTRAWVVTSQAGLRSGHPSARLPGPPCGSLSKGTMVNLVDRPPIKAGRGKTSTSWYAIMPPPSIVQYIRADGTRPAISQRPATPPRNAAAAERLAAYEPTQDGPASVEKLHPPETQPGIRAENSAENLPAGIASEIANVEAMHRAILSDQPIDQWRFETVRARYQAILKRAGANPAVAEAIRGRLARVTQHEQAAGAARTIQTILARSHRRDSEVAAAERRRSNPGREQPRAFSAQGLVKPSARMVDGRRLYSLVGPDGLMVAYLDVPPGLDIEPLLTHRVGVRGVTHYNEDLGARLITVRDVEPIETRR